VTSREGREEGGGDAGVGVRDLAEKHCHAKGRDLEQLAAV
jgi:hypothetical protein